ncbi:MAG: N-succinylarginine dihydrolase, partial [Phycisphaerales bacterium]
PARYPARQTLEASRAIADRHGIAPARCVWAQQHPAAIDQGVFHPDVISVGNAHMLLAHEHAFVDQHRLLDDLDAALGGGAGLLPGAACGHGALGGEWFAGLPAGRGRFGRRGRRGSGCGWRGRWHGGRRRPCLRPARVSKPPDDRRARTQGEHRHDDCHRLAHGALPAHDASGAPGPFGDEGAANHTRLTRDARSGGEVEGVHLFAFGAQAGGAGPRPSRYPARQTLEASRTIADRHGIAPARCVWAQQHPAAIDQGVFHNDVISVGNGHVLLAHEHAFVDQHRVFDDLDAALGGALQVVTVSSRDVTVKDAVETYLFNSQLLTLPDGTMALVMPGECAAHAGVARAVQAMLDDPACPVKRAVHLDVRE